MPVFALILIWGLIELMLIIFVADAIGALMTIGLLVLAVIVGSWLIRTQQEQWRLAIYEQDRNNMSGQSKPMKEGLFRFLAGILLILPGFLSDILAVFLYVPLLRQLLGQQLMRLFKVDVLASKFTYRQSGQVYEHDDNAHDVSGNNRSIIEGHLVDDNNPKNGR